MDVLEWDLLFTLIGSAIVITLLLDWISLLLMRFVFVISGRVLYYRGSYTADDKTFNPFIYLVLAFVASMRFIVLRPNLISSILLGWDGLGLVCILRFSNLLPQWKIC